jgi:hypothetical protein
MKLTCGSIDLTLFAAVHALVVSTLALFRPLDILSGPGSVGILLFAALPGSGTIFQALVCLWIGRYNEDWAVRRLAVGSTRHTGRTVALSQDRRERDRRYSPIDNRMSDSDDQYEQDDLCSL